LIRGNDVLLGLARWGGALFLASYGALALRRAWQGGQLQVETATSTSLATALAACFGFTFLNPHVYLDTVILLGSVASQRADPGQWVFGWGACLASVLWFSALGFGARLLQPVFATATAWRVLDGAIAVIMFALTASLLMRG
jgi:L-lysine exporter family protein LysE/ArgO